MYKNKGLSTIVITLIIILLSLVAVGIVWLVINNFIKTGTQGIDINTKCIGVDMQASAVNCTNGATYKSCDLTLARTGTGLDSIAGVKLVFKNETSDVSSEVINVEGNIEPLVDKRATGIDTGIANTYAINKIEITVYFKDTEGRELICGQTSSYTF